MTIFLLAIALLATPLSADDLTARIDEALFRLDASQGAQTWDVDHRGQTVPCFVQENGIGKVTAQEFVREGDLVEPFDAQSLEPVFVPAENS